MQFVHCMHLLRQGSHLIREELTSPKTEQFPFYNRRSCGGGRWFRRLWRGFREMRGSQCYAKAATGTGRFEAMVERLRLMLSISLSVAAVR